jgi:hypothetical protein
MFPFGPELNRKKKFGTSKSTNFIFQKLVKDCLRGANQQTGCSTGNILNYRAQVGPANTAVCTQITVREVPLFFFSEDDSRLAD